MSLIFSVSFRNRSVLEGVLHFVFRTISKSAVLGPEEFSYFYPENGSKRKPQFEQ